MPASPIDSQITRRLFGDDAAAQLFTDSAEVRAMLLVEGTLARVQGDLGLIPADAAAFIDRAAREVQIDPAALAGPTAQNGVPVPGLLDAFRKAAEAPEMMRYLHWGATSQDILDTALALRLRRLFEIWDDRLGGLTRCLGTMARAHADLPMAARTYGQIATPTSFGAVVAGWGRPMAGWRADLEAVRKAVLQVSLSGAAGTLSAMGDKGPEVRAGLAKALGLTDPGHTWHSDRSGVARLSGYTSGLVGTMGKFGEDVLLMSQSGIEELRIIGGGASSTMPQKQNPVAASALVAVSRTVIGLGAILQGAAMHRQQRDGAAWFTEWLTLSQLCLLTSRCLSLAQEVAETIAPDPARMAALLEGGHALVHAEALTFALSETRPRPDAEAIVKALCIRARTEGRSLADLAQAQFRDLPWEKVTSNGLGQAKAEALAFADLVRD